MAPSVYWRPCDLFRVETGTGWLRGSWQPLVLGLLPPERTGPRPYFAVVVVLVITLVTVVVSRGTVALITVDF
jgi:hypothetical protein